MKLVDIVQYSMVRNTVIFLLSYASHLLWVLNVEDLITERKKGDGLSLFMINYVIDSIIKA